MQRAVKGEVHYISSTFHEPTRCHVQVSEMGNKTTRLIEHKRDMVILLGLHHAPRPSLQHGCPELRQFGALCIVPSVK